MTNPDRDSTAAHDGSDNDGAIAPESAGVPFGKAEVVVTGVRSVLSVVLVLTVYFLLPLDSNSWGPVVVRSVVAVVLLVVVIGWQTLAVVRSGTPALRGVESLSMSVVLVVVVSASAYLSISTGNPESFSEPLDHVDALYLSLMTLTTIGFGDVGTVTSGARIAVMVQMVVNILVLGVAAKVVLGVARHTGSQFLQNR